MRILVTGSHGFIGSRIVVSALARGWDVVGMGRSPESASRETGYVRHDIAEPLPPRDVIGPVDVVVHCAALAAPWARPSAFVATNVRGTRNVVRWCRQNGHPSLVYVSSSSVVYRDADQFDLNEDSPVPPDREQINAYSRSKRIGERAVERYEGPWSVLRPRAVFGPGDTVLLPRILHAARHGLMPVLQARGVQPVRCDITYVDTVAHYVMEAVERQVHGTYMVTNAEQIELYPFLFDLLARLGMEPHAVHVPVAVAGALASAGELVSARLLRYREPVLTRFGVSVLSRSKTFDVSRCLRDLGDPLVSLDEGVERLVAAYG